MKKFLHHIGFWFIIAGLTLFFTFSGCSTLGKIIPKITIGIEFGSDTTSQTYTADSTTQ